MLQPTLGKGWETASIETNHPEIEGEERLSPPKFGAKTREWEKGGECSSTKKDLPATDSEETWRLVNGMKKLPRQRRVSQWSWETAGGGERILGNTNLPTIDEEKSGGLTSLRKRWGKGQSSTNQTGQDQPRDIRTRAATGYLRDATP
jgi:hypothetical protein